VFKAAPQKTMGFQPTCDITEAKDHYMISLDIPGVAQDQLQIEVENQQLKISGERRQEINDTDDEAKHIYFERSFGKFTRAFNLPPEIKSEDIQAHYQDGVLNVAIPKVKKEEPKKISIGVSSEKPSFFKKLVSSKQ
jgi:HSP20 family protein